MLLKTPDAKVTLAVANTEEFQNLLVPKLDALRGGRCPLCESGRLFATNGDTRLSCNNPDCDYRRLKLTLQFYEEFGIGMKTALKMSQGDMNCTLNTASN